MQQCLYTKYHQKQSLSEEVVTQRPDVVKNSFWQEWEEFCIILRESDENKIQ